MRASGLKQEVRIGHVTLRVSHPERAVAFYLDATTGRARIGSMPAGVRC